MHHTSQVPPVRKRIYVAGPLSTAHSYSIVCRNISVAIEAGDQLLRAGYAPFVPHLSHYWNLISPHGWQEWMELDQAWVLVSDAILRLPGDSKGADQEVAWAKEAGIPVFYSIEALEEHFHEHN